MRPCIKYTNFLIFLFFNTIKEINFYYEQNKRTNSRHKKMTELPVALQVVHAHLEIIVETPTVRHINIERTVPPEFCCLLCLSTLCTLLSIVVVFGNSIKIGT